MIIQSVTDPEELRHAHEVVRRLDQWRVLADRFPREQRVPNGPGSDLDGDDAVTAYMQVSHTIQTCLGMAHDNMRAVDEILRPGGELRAPMYAHYPVLRSILEASATAKWILLPEDRRGRVSRALRFRLTDLKHDRDLNAEIRNTLSQLADRPDEEDLAKWEDGIKLRDAQRTQTIREIANDQKIAWSEIKDGLPGTVRVIREVSGVPGAPGWYVAHLWKIMSGLSHPSVSRSVNHSSVDERSERADGVLDALVSASMRWTSECVMAAMLTTHDAVGLYVGRKQIPMGPRH